MAPKGKTKVKASPKTKQGQTLITWEGKAYTAAKLVPLLGIKEMSIMMKYRKGTLEQYMNTRLKLGRPKGNLPRCFVTWQGKTYAAKEVVKLLGININIVYSMLKQGTLEAYMDRRLLWGIPKAARADCLIQWDGKMYTVQQLAPMLETSPNYLHYLRRNGTLHEYLHQRLTEGRPNRRFEFTWNNNTYTAKELCAMLNVSRQFISWMHKEGKLGRYMDKRLAKNANAPARKKPKQK